VRKEKMKKRKESLGMRVQEMKVNRSIQNKRKEKLKPLNTQTKRERKATIVFHHNQNVQNMVMI
jgi:ACT domain-containing protein